jgi:hypothetical protein
MVEATTVDECQLWCAEIADAIEASMGATANREG